ncbi:hypothetical protein SNE40_013016 [Patella caerulea]|uniref:C17orf113 probable zinc finger domain-containing protein n=1 Tax=Patella caerulea TaxID=87958 RepID=A0AAN8JLD3_PATCE
MARLEKDAIASRGIPKKWPLPKYEKWLVCDQENHLLFCKVCVQFGRPVGRDGKTNHFVTGSRGFRTSKLQNHVENDEHILALSAQYASEIKPGQSEIEKGIINLNEKETAKLSKLFITAFYLAQREMPFTEFVELLRLQTVNFDVDLMANYASDKQAKTFVQEITDTMMQDVKRGCFIILCDCYTDSSVIEEEIIYLRYIELNRLNVNQLLSIYVLWD